MGKTSQELFDEGFEKGLDKGKILSTIELYQGGFLGLKNAAEHLGLSEEEFLRLLEEDSKNK